MRWSTQLPKQIVTLLCSLLLLSGVALAKGSSDRASLRVAFYPLEGFFEYDAAGREIGYGVELLDRISRYTGIRFTYVYADSWENTKELLVSGQADVRMPATPPPTPSKALGYTQHSILDTYYAVLTLKSRDDLFYEDLNTLKTLKYAISRSLYRSASLALPLQKVGISTENLGFFDNYSDCRDALESGSVDALISNIMDMNANMKQLGRFSTVSSYITMPIGSPELTTLNDALAQIKLEDPTFLADLYKKWFPERIQTPLTREENQLLSSLGQLKFLFPDGQGYLSRQQKDGTFAGFYPTVAKELCRRLHVSYAEGLYEDATPEGLALCADFYYDYVWADTCGVDITRPYTTANYYEITRWSGKPEPEECRVAAVKGIRVTQDFLTRTYRQKQMVWCESYEACMEAVSSGAADVAYVNSTAAEYYLTLYRYSNLTSTLTDYSHQACFGVWGDDSGLLASALEKALSAISSEELETLMIDSTAQKPEQDLVTEWIYKEPLQSTLLASIVVAVFVALAALALFAKRMQLKNQALLKATNAKQDFLSRMSHDMRTPMNAIIGFSRFGKESTQLAESRSYHEKIQLSAQYLLQLINDSLDLSKLESGKYELHPETYSCEEFVGALTTILLPRAQEKQITLSIRTEGETPQAASFDKIRLQQIFVNLLNNAIKFTPAGGHVSLCISSKPNPDQSISMCFCVSDDGIGMSKEFQQDRLFKPFEQERSSSSAHGTGLGLSIVKDLVTAMGGSITCESALGQGTTFTVMLKTRLETATEQRKAPAQAASHPVSLSGRHVLLCEDHPMNREIAERLLKKKGILVDHAENGQLGFERFCDSPNGYYDAILMDIRMPVMDGIASAKAIRAAGRPDAETVPILALSANTFQEDIAACRDAGMNDHISKPIDPKQLYYTLSKYICS